VAHPDQALRGEHLDGLAGGDPADAVLLHEAGLARQPGRDRSGLDPAAQDRCQLLIERVRRITVQQVSGHADEAIGPVPAARVQECRQTS